MKSIDTETGNFAPASLSTQRVHDIFSSIAHRYERFNALSSLGTYKSWINRLCSVADIKPTDTVLDIAGGTGEVAFAVAEQLRPAKVVCTDLVPEMLAVAQAKYETCPTNRAPIEFAIADGQALPFEDFSFDAATMAYGLRNMPKRQRALAEVFRVLKPGGSFTCLDFSTPPQPLWRAAYNVYLRYMIPIWGKLVTGNAEGFKYLARSIKAFPNQQGVAALFTEAGFENVSWVNCAGGIACIHTATKPH